MIRIFTWAMLTALGLGLTACNSLNAEDKDKDDDEQETTIKFSEAPEAVQKTIKEEAKGATVDTLTKEVEDGKTTYEAENVTIDGKKYDIEVGADGKLLEKEAADAEDDDKDGEHEDDDDDQGAEKEAAAKK